MTCHDLGPLFFGPEVETSAVSATLMVQPPLSTRRRGHVTVTVCLSANDGIPYFVVDAFDEASSG